MIKITKHPLENRSYILSSTDNNQTETENQWIELKSWLNENAPGWRIEHGILTLPKSLPAIETYFTLRYQ